MNRHVTMLTCEAVASLAMHHLLFTFPLSEAYLCSIHIVLVQAWYPKESMSTQLCLNINFSGELS